MQKGTDFVRRIIGLVEAQGGVTLSYVCLRCHRYPLKDYIWWGSMGHGDSSKKGEHRVIGGARPLAGVGRQFNWRDPNGALVMLDSADSSRRCFGPTRHLRVRARMSRVLSSCWQTGGDKLVDTIFKGLQEQGCLKITKRVQEVHRSGQPCGGEDRGPGEEFAGTLRPLSTPPMWGASRGGAFARRRGLARSVKPSTRTSSERNGRTCVASFVEMNKEVNVGSGSSRAKALWKL